MQNPWKALSDKPVDGEYVLSEDKPYIDAFNKKLTHDHHHRINLGYTPEPRLGPVDANVYLLLANPSCLVGSRVGINLAEDIRLIRDIKNSQSLHKAGDENDLWWGNRLKELREAIEPQDISRKICSIEYFPYRSKNFSHVHLRLPSQEYTFDLVYQAVKSGKPIIIVRCYDAWVGAVPELAFRNDLVFKLNSPQSSYISKNNLPPGAFEKVVSALQS